MKKADINKEQLFVEHYVLTNNASESCVLAGYKKESSSQMGYYLKNKLRDKIKERQTESLTDLSGKSITVLQNLLDSGTPNVQFSTAKLVLELSGYNKQNINIDVNTNSELDSKREKELFMELIENLPEDRVQMVEDLLNEFTSQNNKVHKLAKVK